MYYIIVSELPKDINYSDMVNVVLNTINMFGKDSELHILCEEGRAGNFLSKYSISESIPNLFIEPYKDGYRESKLIFLLSKLALDDYIIFWDFRLDLASLRIALKKTIQGVSCIGYFGFKDYSYEYKMNKCIEGDYDLGIRYLFTTKAEYYQQVIVNTDFHGLTVLVNVIKLLESKDVPIKRIKITKRIKSNIKFKHLFELFKFNRINRGE